MGSNEYQRFEKLSFDDFRRMATDDSLSRYEKIGFPNSYRQGKEAAIFQDILGKLQLLQLRNKVVLDIGPGCSELPSMLIDLCRQNAHTLILIDSEEMLSHLPDAPFIRKIAGCYPRSAGLIPEYNGKIDVCLAYSVLHYVFAESNVWEFLDKSLELLTPGGELLIGDVPNNSKRKRFFSSAAGIRFHQEFTGTKEIPTTTLTEISHSKIDDAVIFSLLARARSAGFDAYVVPQASDLPMANRREDILIRRP
jgi:hypothetical protein